MDKLRRILCAGLFFAIIHPVFAAEALLTDIHIAPADDTHAAALTLTVDQPVKYKIFTLANPNRLVIDLPETQYAFSGGKTIDFQQTPITDFRHGIQEGVNLRLVFDLQEDVQFNSSFDKNDKSQPMQIQVLLTQGGFHQLTAKPVTTTVDTEVDNTFGLLKNTMKRNFVVVIDAGHGGKDPGTIGPDHAYEKNITLAIARDLQKMVNQQSGMRAVMTRSDDYYVGLRERLMLARHAKGDIFIAIHADAYKDPYAQGASVFALSLHGASSEAALWLAQKENYSELGGVDLDGIQDNDVQLRSVLIDLSQTATIGASLQLGNDIIKQLGKITPLHHGIVEQAPFMVLKSPDIPSILVETGFLSNPKEETRLTDVDYQERLAKALFSGIKQYYSQNIPHTVTVAASKT